MPRDRAVKAFKEKVRHITHRHQPKSMSKIIGELNPVVRGWGNYFLKGNCQRIFDQLDFWLRNRVTTFKLKRPELLPVKGQRLRRAGCWKSAWSVR
ncbi:hypothetical protein J7K28_02385 [Candidatus Aerophobetes bacterium]|nr:hypothetical protein [Candidatus Aerophobetes bacterium]